MLSPNAVANVVAEMGRDLVFMTTARLSDLSMPLKGEVLYLYLYLYYTLYMARRQCNL